MQPNTSYMVCATQRSGSNLLCEALADTGVAGQPTEYFLPDGQSALSKRWGVSTDAEFVDKVVETGSSPNGVFGVKVMMGGGYFSHLTTNLSRARQHEGQDFSGPALIDATFPNLHHIWVTRRDKVRQAVSWWKATQTDVWGRGSGEQPVATGKPEFNFEAIDYLVQALVLKETSWQEYFADGSIVPCVVVYEDFIRGYEETVVRVLDFLNIPVPNDLDLTAPRLQKQADELSGDWVERYRDLKQSGFKEIQWEYVSGKGVVR